MFQIMEDIKKRISYDKSDGTWFWFDRCDEGNPDEYNNGFPTALDATRNAVEPYLESEPCDECGADIPTSHPSLINHHHLESCSLYENPADPQKESQWFIVMGRIPGDDEDSSNIFYVENEEQAREKFTEWVWNTESSDPLPEDWEGPGNSEVALTVRRGYICSPE